MKVIDEIQSERYYSQEFSNAQLRVLVNLGALAHVHSVVNDGWVQRFFAPVSEAHDFTIVDFRMDEEGEIPAEALEITPEGKYYLEDYS